MSDNLHHVAHRWTELGDEDPMWAALTDSGKGGRWDPQGFLETGRSEIQALLERLDTLRAKPQFGAAVDFGCGPGRLSAALAEAGFERVIGLDVSPTMLAKAREIVRDERVQFVLNDGADLSVIPTGEVDFVYCCRVLQHMPPALSHGYIREFLRIVRPGGIAAFQLPFEPAPNAVGAAMRMLPAPVLNRLRKGMEMHGSTPASVTRLISDSGGVTLAIEEDQSAGPRWRSYLYIARAED